MMKLYLGFLVISLAASAIQHEDNPSDGRLSGHERRKTTNVYECVPGEQLEVNTGPECWSMHFKGCQIWVAPSKEAVWKCCTGTIFEDCYVNIKGYASAPHATYIRSVVEVYDSHDILQSYQTPFATAIDSIVTCFPATYKLYSDYVGHAGLNFSCDQMSFEGHSAFNIPTGAIYPEGYSDPDLIHTKNYAFCYGGADAPECTNYLYYNPKIEDPRYKVQATSDRSCCLSSVKDDRVCLSIATKCEELDFCRHISVVDGGKSEVLAIPGFGKRFGAVLSCLTLGENDCYLEACRHEDGCGREWNFFALVNDTMMPELKGVRNAWNGILDTIRQSALGDSLYYCAEVENSCKEFGDASLECYQKRANTFAPNSVNDPRSIVYTDVNLELKLKAQQKSTFIQDFNDGLVEYPSNRYIWKYATIEVVSTFMQAQRMIRSLDDETVVKGKVLLNELDQTLYALIMVSESEDDMYTTYHGVLLQLMALVRGYSLQPPPLPSSGLLLPIYSANFLLGQLRNMKEDMTYEALYDRLNDVITTVNEGTLTLLRVNAQQLMAEGSAAQVDLDLAISELARSEQQMNGARNKISGMNLQLTANYNELTEAVKEYERRQQAEFWTQIAFTALSMLSGDLGSFIRMAGQGNSNLGAALKICRCVVMAANMANAILRCKQDFPGFGGVVGMPNPFEDNTDSTEAYTTDAANAYMELATQTNEALGEVTPAQFEEYLNEITVNMAPYLNHEDTGVITAATKLLMDVKTGVAYQMDHYGGMIAYASAAGRVAVAIAQIVGLQQVVANIENLQDEIEDAVEEQALIGTVAALQIMLGALNCADLLAQLCNSHMYANGGMIDRRIEHVCLVEGGFVPTPELLLDVLDNKATLGDIVRMTGEALSSFETAPELYYRQMPIGVSSRTALFTFSNEHDNEIEFSQLGLGGFIEGKEMAFSLYKGSPLLEAFTTDNFNNPMLVGYTTLLNGVEIKDPNPNKYIDIRLGFSKSFEVYSGQNPKQFMKPTSTDWPVSSVRPMYNNYCHNTPVESPETGKLFCSQSSLSNSQNPPSSKDDLFAFDSIYTTYTLTLRNPEILVDMTDDEKENIRLSLFFYYQNTVGEASSEAQEVRRLSMEKHHSKLSGRPMSLEQVEENGFVYIHPFAV